jgi:hypothetical protein
MMATLVAFGAAVEHFWDRNDEKSAENDRAEQFEHDIEESVRELSPEQKEQLREGVHAIEKALDDEAEPEMQPPDFQQIAFDQSKILDFPEKDISRRANFVEIPSTDKRIVDRMQASPDFASAYQAVVQHLQWDVDHDFVRVTSPAEFGGVDVSFQLAQQDGAPVGAEGWYIEQYQNDQQTSNVNLNDIEGAVYSAVKNAVAEAAEKSAGVGQ